MGPERQACLVGWFQRLSFTVTPTLRTIEGWRSRNALRSVTSWQADKMVDEVQLLSTLRFWRLSFLTLWGRADGSGREDSK